MVLSFFGPITRAPPTGPTVAEAAESTKWRMEAAAMKRDIRAALFEAMGKSPVIPLGDGSWRPTVPPRADSRGPLLLSADGGQWFSHRAFSPRDSLLGPLYLVVTEVLEPHELATTFMLSFHMDTRCMLYLEKGETL